MEGDPPVVQETDASVEETRPSRNPVSLALTLTLAALLIWFGFQAVLMARERGNLSLVRASQDSAIQEADKVRAQFEALINKLSDLANKGHAGAKMILDELQNRGAGAGPESAMPQPPPSK